MTETSSHRKLERRDYVTLSVQTTADLLLITERCRSPVLTQSTVVTLKLLFTSLSIPIMMLNYFPTKEAFPNALSRRPLCLVVVSLNARI
jgi:hypothetical protein